jgi:hypothetical protein
MDAREQFKLLAAGKFAMINIEGTVDIPTMLKFVDGAIFAYDLLKKQTQRGGMNETRQDCAEQTYQIDE